MRAGIEPTLGRAGGGGGAEVAAGGVRSATGARSWIC